MDPELIKFLILLISILVLSYGINAFLLTSIGGIYRLFVAPGVILHELSHAFACFFTGTKVTSINMFKKDGGEVRHARSKIPILGPIFISLAPFLVGGIAIYFFSRWMGLQALDINEFTLNPAEFLETVKQSFIGIELNDVTNWALLYLALSIAVTMIPSFRDLGNIIISIILAGIVVFLIYRYTPFRFDPAWVLRPELFIVMGAVVALLIVSLILSIIIYIIKLFVTV